MKVKKYVREIYPFLLLLTVLFSWIAVGLQASIPATPTLNFNQSAVQTAASQ